MLDATDLTNMRAVQEGHMHDTCILRQYTIGNDAYGLNNPYYVALGSYSCGFHAVNPREQQAASFVPGIDARLRLSESLIDTIDPKDRIELTHRYGEALTTTLTFEIVGPIKHGPSGLVLDLKLVSDGSEV